MAIQHTQTPWVQVGGLVLAHDGMVAVCEVVTRKGAETPGSERLENGAFIVRACNAHDELIAAATAALVDYDQRLARDKANRVYDWIATESPSPSEARKREALRRAALTKATTP